MFWAELKNFVTGQKQNSSRYKSYPKLFGKKVKVFWSCISLRISKSNLTTITKIWLTKSAKNCNFEKNLNTLLTKWDSKYFLFTNNFLFPQSFLYFSDSFYFWKNRLCKNIFFRKYFTSLWKQIARSRVSNHLWSSQK